MRKRKYDKIDKKKIEDIRFWLASNDKDECPFFTRFVTLHEDCDICLNLFPKLGNPSNHLCPCDTFETAYVKKIAKRVIEKMGGES